ncbi:MAG: trypsin-like peptidase domain-containing protein [Dehalococcoidia bacterium]|nr:trypsin-like peptidase domain-containing protein [Dehalococcoidia bacterium]
MTAPTLPFTTGVFAEASEELAAHLRSVVVAVRTGAGGGSGTLWSADGLVVTNHHVVPGETAEVVLGDGRAFAGRVVSHDPGRDLAAIRIPVSGVPSAKPADSDGVRVGQLVFAAGHPWGERGVVTAGIVLAKGPATVENQTPLDDAIQADVRLAPGNSGGPLADAEGRVIGINSMIAGGIAVAVPSNAVERLLAGEVPGRAFLGIEGRPIPLPPAVAASFEAVDGAGLLVTEVAAASPAERAGLLPGDILLRVDGAHGGLRRATRKLERLRPGAPTRLEFLRGWSFRETEATPVARD